MILYPFSYRVIAIDRGVSSTEANIASWIRKSGDYILLDDAILELETDKATLVVTAENEGTLEILAEEGETVNLGDVIGYITPKPDKVLTDTAFHVIKND